MARNRNRNVTATATETPVTPVVATETPVVPASTLHFRRIATNGRVTYGIAGKPGVATFDTPIMDALMASPVVATYRRSHPGGGSMGRVSYGVAGCKGIIVLDAAWFPDGLAIAGHTMTVAGMPVDGAAYPVALAVSVAFKGATVATGDGATSARVASANRDVATATGDAIATPDAVADAVGPAAAVALAK